MATNANAGSLWFAIEAAFTDIQNLCVRARAAQLAQERALAQPKALKRTLVSSPAMVEDFEPTFREGDPRLARAVELSRDLAFQQENAQGPNFVVLRDLIGQRLKWLENRFAEALNDHDRYYALFPLAVYVDELVLLGTRGEASRWDPLQSALFNIDNGGEEFFNILEDKLRQPKTHPVVFEVFYFCLADGFTGVYQDDPGKIEEYKQRLAKHIPVRATPATARTEPTPAPSLVSFPWGVYVAAAVLVIGVHVLLLWLASPPPSP